MRWARISSSTSTAKSTTGGANWPKSWQSANARPVAVPRSKERFGTIAVNALAFAGSLLARDDEEMKALREAGPMRALREVAVPPWA